MCRKLAYIIVGGPPRYLHLAIHPPNHHPFTRSTSIHQMPRHCPTNALHRRTCAAPSQEARSCFSSQPAGVMEQSLGRCVYWPYWLGFTALYFFLRLSCASSNFQFAEFWEQIRSTQHQKWAAWIASSIIITFVKTPPFRNWPLSFRVVHFGPTTFLLHNITLFY